jgi:uncharacterized membrane protein
MTNRRFSLHYLSLTGIIAVGAMLRFANLDLKPLWMDEVITAIFSLGKQYSDVPLDVVFPLEQLQDIFTYQPRVSCSQIAHTIANQSTHPPLFFCLMHTWLGWLSLLGKDWVMKLRSLPALFGVSAIAAIYCVNRLAFSKAAALTAAMLMAVSPFAVYLSQEARHYTLPMLLITLSLLGLVQIQQDIFQRQKLRIRVWLAWTITNIIGLYIHYFFVLAFIAEVGTLFVLMYYSTILSNNNKLEIKTQSTEEFSSIDCEQMSSPIILKPRQIWLALIISISAVAFSFLPWLPVLVSNYERPETDWLDPPYHIAPFYQTLINWVLMVIALPVEKQSLFIKVISVLLMLFFAIWVGWLVYKKLKQMWCKQTTHLSTITLLSFLSIILLEFFVIAYLLQKDITTVPRYNFVYYPSFCALISASLTKFKNTSQETTLSVSTKLKIPYACLQNYQLSTILIVGFISSIFVICNLVFLKPYEPEKVAQNMNQDPSMPLMVVVGYKNYQDVALGLSFALALEKVRSERVGEWESGEKNQISNSQFPIPNSQLPSSDFAFFKQAPDFGSVWQKLSQLPPPTTNQLNLWVVAPGLKRRDYPQQLAFSQTTICTKDTAQHYRVGIPYQLYRCGGSVGNGGVKQGKSGH